jgi:hypothetical protein
VSTIWLVGAGAVGGRAARQLVDTPDLERLLVTDADAGRAAFVADLMGERAEAVAWSTGDPIPDGVRGVAIALPAGPDHETLARLAIERGIPCVSCSDAPEVAESLLGLDADARAAGVSIVAGAGFAPGLSDVLAALAASLVDEVDEIHVARSGVAGPACAAQRHRAGQGHVQEWHDGSWRRSRAGSGRELVWFPDPVAGEDCYRIRSGQVPLLRQAFPGVDRITMRAAARRRDRLAARLPMLIRPEPEGGWGALRVEVRGRRARAKEIKVYGAIDRMASATGAVLGLTALVLVGLEEALAVPRPGTASVAEVVQPRGFLGELARRGVRAAVFDGAEGSAA